MKEVDTNESEEKAEILENGAQFVIRTFKYSHRLVGFP
jgi:hypothetical protein